MVIGVVLVTYNASDTITDCLDSLMMSKHQDGSKVDLRIVIVDNASRDETKNTVRNWANQQQIDARSRVDVSAADVSNGVELIEEEQVSRLDTGQVGLIAASKNLGFAGGVNLGLRSLIENGDVDSFWILNPDCVADPDTAARLLKRAEKAGRFGVIGGRVYYASPQDMIQSDGGRINMWTGICVPFNMTRVGSDVPAPDEGSLDYISGAHMFVSREFIACAGFMPEDYFLYYEEMDWCLRRGDLPLLFEPEATVRHHGGRSVGSATINQGPSALSAYFMNRSRTRFVARYRPAALPLTYAYSTARALRALVNGQRDAGFAALRGLWGLKPSRSILARIGLESLP